jgi:hypothetical protein
MKPLIICFLFISVHAYSQSSEQRAELDKALTALKGALETKKFSLLKPHLDSAYTVGEFKMPRANEIVPQLVAQGNSLENFKIKRIKYEKDKILVSIEYETAGHFGTTKTTSDCILTLSNKYISINYFDEMLSKAKRVSKH